MTQQYTPVAWQDETTSQQGTLINAERLNQMQTAHHYADGFEEVDTVPTADPSVAYHKVVYCTADSTFYRWDGTEWTKDIDDETKALLQEEIARATEAEGELAQDLADETTARETADTAMQADITAMQGGKLDKKTTAPNQTQAYAVRGSTQRMITVGYGPESIPIYGIEETLLAKMPTLYDPTADTVVNYGWATAQIGAEATARAEADTLLGNRITDETAAREGADTALGNRITAEETRATQAEQTNAQAIANTYTKTETDTLLASKADSTALTTLSTRVDTLDAQNVKLTGDQVLSNGIKANTTAGSSSASATRDVPPRFVVQSTGLIRTESQGVNRHYPVAGLNDRNGNPVAKINVATTDNEFQVYLQGIGKDEAQGTLMLAKFDRATDTWTPTIANDALDAYLPMVRTTGNQSIYNTKRFSELAHNASEFILGEYYTTEKPWVELSRSLSGTDIYRVFIVTPKRCGTASHRREIAIGYCACRSGIKYAYWLYNMAMPENNFAVVQNADGTNSIYAKISSSADTYLLNDLTPSGRNGEIYQVWNNDVDHVALSDEELTALSPTYFT